MEPKMETSMKALTPDEPFFLLCEKQSVRELNRKICLEKMRGKPIEEGRYVFAAVSAYLGQH